MLWKMLGADHPMEAHKIDSRFIYELGKGNDAKEGVDSFLEKRPRIFQTKYQKICPNIIHGGMKRSLVKNGKEST